MLRRFARSGFLALNPPALLEMFPESPKREVKLVSGFSVIEIFGPLVHHDGDWCDSYDAISERVAQACAAAPDTIILKIDSPGGEVSGCMDTAREIRAKCEASGKRLVTYVDGMACSAAYALACAASLVVVPPTGIVGSIGVLHTRVDVSAQDAAFGMRFAIVVSGDRKADGNPHTSLTDTELASSQLIVNELAGVFFGLVSDMRGLTTDQISAFEAGLFTGMGSVKAKLADAVQSFDELLASLAGPTRGNTMATPMEEARTALEKAAEGDGEDAKKAKAALAAMDAAMKDEECDAEAEEGQEKDKEAESEEPDGDEDGPPPPKKEEASVSAKTAGQLAASANTLAARVAKLEKQDEEKERDAFLASRSDLSSGLVAVLKTKPIAEVKAIVAEIPKPKVPKKALGVGTVAATRGVGQDSTPEDVQLPASDEALMDARMGITEYDFGARKQEYTGKGVVHMEFGVMPKKKAPAGSKEGA
jgi:ClpP class serine protease